MLLLRDVFDYSVRQTADALGLSQENVKTAHHRARRAMRAYDGARRLPTRVLQAETRAALERFVAALATGDQRAIESLLADDVRAVSDGGGEFHAARVPVIGRTKVARFYAKIASRRAGEARSDIRLLNGLPALVTELGGTLPGEATRLVLRVEIGPAGRIVTLHTVLASRKLAAVRFPAAA